MRVLTMVMAAAAIAAPAFAAPAFAAPVFAAPDFAAPVFAAPDFAIEEGAKPRPLSATEQLNQNQLDLLRTRAPVVAGPSILGAPLMTQSITNIAVLR